MSASVTWGPMTDRREGERRQLIEPKFLAQTAVMVLLSAASAFYASYMGTQTKTLLLERAVAGVEKSVDELVRMQSTLTATINQQGIVSATATAKLESAVMAREREIDETKQEMRRANKEMSDALRLQEIRAEGIRMEVATLKGEMNAERKRKE
jgi:hypothetical protein